MANFIQLNLGDDLSTWSPDGSPHDLYSRWILSRLGTLLRNTNRLFDSFLYGEAGRQLHDFLWREFADWYIEISKTALYSDDEIARQRTLQTLVHVLETCLRLLHPFMPFVTEEIWQHLPHEGETIMLAPWPDATGSLQDPEAEAAMDTLVELVRGIRNVRAEYNVPNGRAIHALLRRGALGSSLDELRVLFAGLCRIEDLSLLSADASEPVRCATVVVNDSTVYLPLAELIDIAAERQRLGKERDQLQQRLQRSQDMLANEKFVARAPAAVVERERAGKAELEASLELVVARLRNLG